MYSHTQRTLKQFKFFLWFLVWKDNWLFIHSDIVCLKMFYRILLFFLVIIPRISTGKKVMYLTEVIINWHEEILHPFSEVFSSLLQLFLCSLSFTASVSPLGFQSFHYGIQNTSFSRILSPEKKQANRIMAGYGFIL